MKTEIIHRNVTGIYQIVNAILGCCNGDKKSYKGFHWHYVELNSDKLLIKGKK